MPNKCGGLTPFRTKCEVPSRVIHDNAMVLTPCSSYMFTKRLGNASRCSFDCRVPEGLFNLWESAGGFCINGRTCVHGNDPWKMNIDQIALDACQIDDFRVGAVAAMLAEANKVVKIYSKDGRFRSKWLQLPLVRYPLYCVIQTREGEVAVPFYQRDLREIFRAVCCQGDESDGKVGRQKRGVSLWTQRGHQSCQAFP